MAKILILAQGDHIVQHAQQFRATLDRPEDMEIVLAHMDEAVAIARRYAGTSIEVVMARSTSADVLRQAGLPFAVVEIPVSDEEIIESIMKARGLARPGTPIGLLGFSNIISVMKTFLGLLAFPVRLYEIFNTRQARAQIAQAKKDGVSVIISGAAYTDLAEKAGMKSVLMSSSVASIARAYAQARELLAAIGEEKKKTQETRTIFNAVSDAIVSLDAAGRVTMVNRIAAELFRKNLARLAGAGMDALFSSDEQDRIRRVIASGEENIGGIVERHGRQYAVRVVPIMVGDSPEGAVVTLQEIKALQRMEVTVRQGLYQRGNVARYVFSDIKGKSDPIREAVDTAGRFSQLRSNILIVGETGTGKELFAQSIHSAGPRRDGPFVAVNCGAIPSHLVESELFGYEEGAFTGARRGGRMGLFELAHGGTIFLDEISEMDQAGQVNLLRALQERQIRRVGGNTVIPVDVRVIAACNANLADMVRDNRFRRDLYYRLSVLVLELPPLRRRPADISHLAAFFLRSYADQFGKRAVFSRSALRTLEEQPWEGNVRQLRNFCERIAAVADSDTISADFVAKHLRDSLWALPEPQPASSPDAPEAVVIRRKIYTRDQLASLLAAHRGSRDDLAHSLGISRTTLWKHCKALGL